MKHEKPKAIIGIELYKNSILVHEKNLDNLCNNFVLFCIQLKILVIPNEVFSTLFCFISEKKTIEYCRNYLKERIKNEI